MDITMCLASNCPYETSCYRKTANADPHYQALKDYSYNCNADSGFEDFIQARIQKKIKQE